MRNPKASARDKLRRNHTCCHGFWNTLRGDRQEWIDPANP
jgi:hypothetical protein